MQLLGHRVTGGKAEVGVQGQYLDSELHLVDDSLSGGLVARPQFEIGKFVVEAVSIFVMNAFKLGQWAIEMLRHHVAVFQDFSTAAEMHSHVARRVHVPIGIDGPPRSAFPSTFFAAKFLAFVVARMATVFGFHQATFFRNATQLALKSRDGFFVHVGQLLDSPVAVKGVV